MLACMLCALAIVMPEKEARNGGTPPPSPSPAATESPVLGPLHHARGPVHQMTRAELQAELRERRVPQSASDSNDRLKMRLHDARVALLDQRNERIAYAESVMQEVNQHCSPRFLSDNSLDTILADDNAVYTATLSRSLLSLLRKQAAVGAALGFVMWWFMPLGKIEVRHRLLPLRFHSSSAVGYFSVSLVTTALLGLLQVVTQNLRRWFNLESFFGQKLAAVTCREGIIEWMIESDQSALTLTSSVHMSRLFRRSTIVPVLSMAAGRSAFPLPSNDDVAQSLQVDIFFTSFCQFHT